VTTRAGVIGDPIAHSLSPVLHGAWIAALGLDAAYDRIHVTTESFTAFVAEHRGGGRLAGVNVTIPHKEAALAAADIVEPIARRAGAANLLLFHADGRVEARNTDGLGLLGAFEVQAPGFDITASPVLVVGAGGAARGAVAALVQAGCRDVRIVNRTLARAAAIAVDFPGAVTAISEGAGAERAVGAVINATSLGLGGGSGPAVDWDAVLPGAVAMDMVYKPLRTAFLDDAAAAGRRTVDGLEMLIRQAVPSFEAFYGVAAPASVDVRALALAALEPSA
jgi:shikimate dehydrogenase